MTTALTVYFTNTASSTLSTANILYTTAGTPTNAHTYSRVGTATGYGEITSQGTTGAWAAAGSDGAPTGSGFLFDVTTLELQQLVAGNYTPTLRLNCAQSGDFNPQAGALTADLVVRGYKRTSGGVYTQIFRALLTGQALTVTFTTYNLPAVSASAASFATGDKLYIDVWANVTSNTGGFGNQDIRLNRLSTDVTGMTGDATVQVVTPGFMPAQTLKDTATRLRLLSVSAKDIGARLLLQLTNTVRKDTSTRLRLRMASFKFLSTRLQLVFTPTTTPLFLYATRLQSLLSPMANTLVPLQVLPQLGTNMQLGTALGIAEFTSQGSFLPWASLGAVGSPTGNGWLFDAPTLENQQLLPGTWSPTITLSTSVGMVLADVTIRMFVRSVFGTYTQIATTTASAQQISTKVTIYSPTPAGRQVVNLRGGERLYADVWLNITQTTGTDASTLLTNIIGAGSLGQYGGLVFVLPSYQKLPIFDVMARMVLTALIDKQDLRLRLRITDPPQLDCNTRLRLQ